VYKHEYRFPDFFPTKKHLASIIIITFATLHLLNVDYNLQHIRYIDPTLEHLRYYCTTTITTVIIEHHDTHGREISMALSCHNRLF